MRFKIFAILFIFITGLGVTAGAQQLVSLFDFGDSVRATGMGGGFAGLADDEQALLYNPAGLALLSQLYAHATFQSHLSISSVSGLMSAIPSFGLGLQLFDVGGLTQFDDNDNEGPPFSYGQFSLLGAAAFRLGALIGVPSLRELGLGLRFKFLSVNTLAAGSGATFALDPSVLWELGQLRIGSISIQSIRVGATLDNLGPGITYGSGYQESLGLGVRVGASASIQGSLIATLELNTYSGLHLGGEYRIPVQNTGTVFVRTGVSTQNTFTFHLGLGFLYQRLVRVDYAFSSHGQLFGSHQLAVAVAFPFGRP